MRFSVTLLITILIHTTVGMAQPIGDISLGQIIGSSADDSVGIGPLTFNFRFTIDSTSEVVSGITNGFEIYSPDGATWENLYGDTINSLGSFSYFLSGIVYHSADGTGYDTVGFYGVFWDTAALNPGSSHEILSINLELQTDDYGKTICIDSAFYPTSGLWKWSSPSLSSNVPNWGGPYCFLIGIFMDLSLSSDHITLSPTIPNEDQETQISVVVRNNSYETATDFYVEIASDSEFVSLIDAPMLISELLGGVDSTVVFSWTAIAGVDKIYARVDGSNSLIEYDENNNRGEKSLYVIPFLGLTASIDPTDINAELGDTLQLQIEINNRTVLEHDVEIVVNGLGNYVWSLTSDTVNMLAGELEYVQLNVVMDENCAADTGIVNFDVVLTAVDDPIVNTSTSGSIHISKLPTFANLLPEAGQTLAINAVTFMWKTKTESTSKVYYKKINDQDFSFAVDTDATFHTVFVTGLEFDAEYVWYAESQTSCGISFSDTISFKIGRGVTFGQNSYSYTIRRSYDQRASLQINNTDSSPHEVLVEIINPYDDMIIGFVGDGSIDQVVELGAGSGLTLDLGMHAQDAEQEEYNIAFRLISTAADNSKLYDYSNVSIQVDWPDTNFTLTDLGRNPYNLIQTMRLQNHGDSITDFNVEMDNEVGVNYMINPEIGHAILAPGRYIDFELTPIFQDGGGTTDATVIAVGAGKSITYDLTESCDKQLFYVEEPKAMICLEHGVNSWYCTNKPSVNMSFTVPFIGSGIANSGTISMEFMPHVGNIKPHDVRLYLNGHLIGELIQTNPLGIQEFNFNPAFLINSSAGPSKNILRIESQKFNGGHYAIKTNMSMCLCVSDYGEYICANTFIEAEDILRSKPYFFLSTPTAISINEPSEGATIQKLLTNSLVVDVEPAHKRYTVIADVAFTGGTTQQVKLNYNESEQLYYANWLPDECENAIVTVTATNCDEMITSSAVNVVIDAGNCATPPSYGTTIIIHGLNPFGKIGDTFNDEQKWVLPMANAIVGRLGGGRIFRIENGVRFGNILPLTQVDPGEQVITFNWIPESNESVEGFAEAAADALFAKLVEGAILGLWNLNQLHFIGHSRGTIVASETIQRLGLFTEDLAQLSSPIAVDTEIHLTTLDPHPWDSKLGDCVGDPCSAKDESVNNGNNDVQALDANLSKAVITWDNIRYRDNFYQQNCYDTWDALQDYLENIHDGLVLDGISNDDLKGVNDNPASNLSDILGVSLFQLNNTHTKVHTWYYGTINTLCQELSYDGCRINESIYWNVAGWYNNAYGPRSNIGFGIGRNFPLNSSDLDIIRVDDIDRVPIGEDDKLSTETIFNGDFSLKRTIFTGITCLPDYLPFLEEFLNNLYEGSNVPGWNYQGGDSDIFLFANKLNLYGGKPKAEHNWTYIPSNATHLAMSFECYDYDVISSQDYFKVLIDGVEIGVTIPLNRIYWYDWLEIPISGSSLPGTVRKITLMVGNDAGSDLDSRVWIDDVHFILNDNEIVKYKNKGTIAVLSPVDIVVTDPDGLYVNKDTTIIDGAEYDYFIKAENDSGIFVTIPFMKKGIYHVDVTARASANPSDVYSIYAYYEGALDSVAVDVSINDIPIDGYEINVDYCCIPPMRGNVNGDVLDQVDISDLTFLVDYMFKSGPEPSCMDEANINGLSITDISDLTALVSYMFKGGPPPVGCP